MLFDVNLAFKSLSLVQHKKLRKKLRLWRVGFKN